MNLKFYRMNIYQTSNQYIYEDRTENVKCQPVKVRADGNLMNSGKNQNICYGDDYKFNQSYSSMQAYPHSSSYDQTSV